MSWASRRRTSYLFIFFGVLFLIAAGVTYSFFSTPASCSDGKKNGTEEGVDCGGGCAAVCREKIIAPTVHFARAFEVLPGVYNAVAYVENANAGSGTKAIPYVFKLLDERGVLIVEREGVTYLSPNGISPVIEATIAVGARIPSQTQFSFTAEPRWERAQSRIGEVVVSDTVLDIDAGRAPRLTAVIRNTTVKAIENITLVVTLFDENRNAVAASSTFVPRLEKGGREEIVFTWPQPFSALPVQIDILPRLPL